MKRIVNSLVGQDKDGKFMSRENIGYPMSGDSLLNTPQGREVTR